MEKQNLVEFCQTSDFSFINFVRVGLDWIFMLIYQIRSLKKHSPLISTA